MHCLALQDTPFLSWWSVNLFYFDPSPFFRFWRSTISPFLRTCNIYSLFFRVFFFFFFNSLAYSVLYLVTPVLVTLSLSLVVWWGPSSSGSPRRSLGYILAGLVLLSVAWRLEEWPGWALNPCLILVLNFVKILFYSVSVEKSTPTLAYFPYYTLGLANQRLEEFFEISKV